MAFPQGVWNEGADPGQWEAAGTEDLPQDVLLHHAGRHPAAAPHGAGSHDGESWAALASSQSPRRLLSPPFPLAKGSRPCCPHAYLIRPLSGLQVSANLKLNEKQEVKKELVSQGGVGGGGTRRLPFPGPEIWGARWRDLGGRRGVAKAGMLDLREMPI